MNFLKRLEVLEAAAVQTAYGVGYKLILVKDGESYDEAVIRLGVRGWPGDRIIIISFVKADSRTDGERSSTSSDMS